MRSEKREKIGSGIWGLRVQEPQPLQLIIDNDKFWKAEKWG